LQDRQQDLAQLGLSVVEKFLKSKPQSLEVVQLAPASNSGIFPFTMQNDEPLEVVNLSDDIDEIGDSPRHKRHKSTSDKETSNQSQDKE